MSDAAAALAEEHDLDANLKKARFDAVEPYLEPCLYTLVAIGLLLDIASCCKLKFAGLILYYELAFWLLQGILPFDYGELYY